MPSTLPQPQINTTLNEDQQAVVAKNLRDAMFACQTILEFLGRSPQVPEVASSALAVAEYRLGDAAKAMGIETDGAAERTERYAKLRSANERVRELERLLGQGASAQQTQAAVKVLAQRLNKWWDIHGFGHISELRFTESGYVSAKFSCMLFGAFRLTGSKTPVSDKQRRAEWLQSLRDRGYDVRDSEDSRDMELLDTDASRKVLADLFREHLPSSRVTSISNHGEPCGRMVMKDVTVIIFNLQDVEQLEVPEDVAEEE